MNNPNGQPPQPTGIIAIYFALFYACVEATKLIGAHVNKRKREKNSSDAANLTESNRLAGLQQSFTQQALDRIEALEARELLRDKAHQEEINALTDRHRQEVSGLNHTIATQNDTIAQLTKRVSELEHENLESQRKLLSAN